jgi:hypothetical protein
LTTLLLRLPPPTRRATCAAEGTLGSTAAAASAATAGWRAAWTAAGTAAAGRTGTWPSAAAGRRTASAAEPRRTVRTVRTAELAVALPRHHRRIRPRHARNPGAAAGWRSAHGWPLAARSSWIGCPRTWRPGLTHALR